MVTDGQVLELWRWLGRDVSLSASARMARMDEKTARKYREDPRLPSARKTPRVYRTRLDPFAEVWAEVEARLEADLGSRPRPCLSGCNPAFPASFPTRPGGRSSGVWLGGEARPVPTSR